MSRQDLIERTADEPEDRVGLEMLAKVEQGRKAPSARTLAKLARALGLEPTELAARAAHWEAGAGAGATTGALRATVLTPWGSVKAANSVSSMAGGAVLGSVASLVTPFPLVVGGAIGAMYGRERARKRELVAALEQRLQDLLENGSEEQLAHLAETLEDITALDTAASESSGGAESES